ncbi:MAG TPA: Hpt domain-containing protein [Terricaulis sp.]|nr:Hpt domain-containing protein [Terricaulis sp.]
MSKPKVQFISAREAGMPLLDAAKPVFDADAVARADETLQAMSGSFQQWLEADIRKLQQARLDAEHAAWSDPALEQLWGVAHDIKGMGESYGYPLATHMAASLCRLIETPAGRAAARAKPALVTAHVDTLRAIVRDQIKSIDHPIGRALMQTLTAQIEKLGVAPR